DHFPAQPRRPKRGQRLFYAIGDGVRLIQAGDHHGHFGSAGTGIRFGSGHAGDLRDRGLLDAHAWETSLQCGCFITSWLWSPGGSLFVFYRPVAIRAPSSPRHTRAQIPVGFGAAPLSNTPTAPATARGLDRSNASATSMGIDRARPAKSHGRLLQVLGM